MSKWSKIEDKINALLIRVAQAIHALIIKSTPQKIKTLIKSSIERVQKFFVDLINKIITKKNNFIDWVRNSIKYITVESREGLRDGVKKLKELQKIRLKDISPKTIFEKNKDKLQAKWQGLSKNLEEKIQRVGKKNIVTLSLLFVISVGILSQIYFRSRKIFIGTGIMRDPASISTEATYPNLRPKYYKKDEKHLLIRGIRFPVYVGSRKTSRSVTIDLTVTTSNKYIRAYLDENHHLVNDIFNTKIEPIIPDFPLKEEGQILLKEKIKKELIILLQELKIDGSIENVHIHAITSG